MVGMSNIVDGRVPVNWLLRKSAKSKLDHWSKPSRMGPSKLLSFTRRTAWKVQEREREEVR
jgi:hypothetical protein